MTNDWYTPDDAHLLAAKKMATWRNGDAKLESTDVHAIDEYLLGRLFPPVGLGTPYATGASYLASVKTTQYYPGTWEEFLFLQTGMNLYPAMGTCTTAGSDPYTHTIGLRTTQTPVNQGRHWERENVTDAESERIDIVGMMLNSLHMECSDASKVGMQHNRWGVAYSKHTSTDDIAASSLTDAPFDWSQFTFSTFTYNSETIEADIIGWSFDVVNTMVFVGLDTSGYYTKGKYIPITQLVTMLEIIPYGHNAFELMKTPIESYATDLDLVVKCTRSTNDYIQWTHDKCFCQPFVINATKAPGKAEKYILVMSQLSTGSLAIEVKDSYDNTYYEGS